MVDWRAIIFLGLVVTFTVVAILLSWEDISGWERINNFCKSKGMERHTVNMVDYCIKDIGYNEFEMRKVICKDKICKFVKEG